MKKRVVSILLVAAMAVSMVACGSKKDDSTDNKTEETKKVAKLSIAGTDYDVDKIEKNKIRVKMGSQTSNTTTVNNSMAKAAELTMLINSGKYPIDYEVQNNRFVHSDITNEQLLYFAGAVAVILLVIFVVLIIKYKSKGFLASISCIGFIALLSLVLIYTNVIITIEGIGAIILVILIDLKLSQMMLNKTKILNVVREAVNLNAPPSYKGKRLKIYFCNQVSNKPPRFNFQVNSKGLVHFSYLRYLENKLRESFDFEGTPIIIQFKNKGEQ